LLKSFVAALVALGPWGVLALAFLDSTGVPVSAGVDALVIFLALQSPHTAWLPAALAVLGSTLGNLALLAAARRGGRRFDDRAAQPGRAQRFRNWFRRYGLITVFIPAFLPIPLPLKLFVISAGVTRTSRVSFLGTVVLARVLRYGSEAWLAVVLGHSSLDFLKQHALHFVIGGVLLFVILYALVRFSDKTRGVLHSHKGIPMTPPSGSGSKLN
jgi:membrane protein YqaA with SNARE-associated domain